MFFNIYRCCLSQLCIAIILAIAYYRVPFSKILIRCNTISIVQASFGDQTASRISVCLIIQLLHLRYCHRFIYLEIIHFFLNLHSTQVAFTFYSLSPDILSIFLFSLLPHQLIFKVDIWQTKMQKNLKSNSSFSISSSLNS